MDLKYFQNFADSIPKRMQWLIENNGEIAKYLIVMMLNFKYKKIYIFTYPMLVPLFSNFKVNFRKINSPRTPHET
jgi:hypothetical protein